MVILIKAKTLKQLFQRYRRPGNLFFAVCFLVLTLVLLSKINSQTVWKSSSKWAAQPALWPVIGLVGMTVFALLNTVSAFVSPKIPGRWEEIKIWLHSFEYVAWFMVYVFIVPYLGYLPSTIVFSVLLTWRVGYHTPKMLVAAALIGVVTVVVFKTLLRVNVPGGRVYEVLPEGLRAIMLTYF